MKYGPVLSHLYDTIRGQSTASDRWAEHIHKEGYKLTLKQRPGRGKLSKREIAKLSEVSERYRQFEDFDLSQSTHDFAEWKKSYQSGDKSPIPWEDALRAQGKPDMIPVAEKEAAAHTALNVLLGS
jgi:hypothetical protein